MSTLTETDVEAAALEWLGTSAGTPPTGPALPSRLPMLVWLPPP